MWPILKRPSAFSKMRQTAAVNIILEATAHLPGKCTDDHSYNRAVFNYLNLHPLFSKLFAWVYTWKCEKHGSHFTKSDNCLSLCVKEVLFAHKCCHSLLWMKNINSHNKVGEKMWCLSCQFPISILVGKYGFVLSGATEGQRMKCVVFDIMTWVKPIKKKKKVCSSTSSGLLRKLAGIPGSNLHEFCWSKPSW